MAFPAAGAGWDKFSAEYEAAQAVLAKAHAQFGCVTAEDVAVLAASGAHRLTQLLVRCGGCRFIAAAQDVQHLIDIITTDGRDYVRDVSVYRR